MELRWELIFLAGELWALSPVMSVLGLRSRPSKQGVLQESWCPPAGSHDALCSLGPHTRGPPVTGWCEESRSPQPALRGSLVPPPSSALRTSRGASVEDVGCLVCGWSPTSPLGQRVEEAGKAAKSCPLLLPVGKWAQGGRVPAQGHTAVSGQGSGACFPPVLPPCLRSVLFVLKPVPGLCWSLCVCLFSVLPLA